MEEQNLNGVVAFGTFEVRNDKFRGLLVETLQTPDCVLLQISRPATFGALWASTDDRKEYKLFTGQESVDMSEFIHEYSFRQVGYVHIEEIELCESTDR